MKSDFFLTGCTKSNLKCVIGLNVTAKMLKLLGKKKNMSKPFVTLDKAKPS